MEQRLSSSQHAAGPPPEAAAAAVATQHAEDADAADHTAGPAKGPLAPKPSLSSVPADVLQQIDAEAGEGQRRPFQPQQDDAGAELTTHRLCRPTSVSKSCGALSATACCCGSAGLISDGGHHLRQVDSISRPISCH